MGEPTLSCAEAHQARAAARLARQVALALDDVELTPAQYRVLVFLADGQAAASAVAGRLSITRPSATELIDGLEGRGFVERRSDPDDRRRTPLRLTADGRSALAAADRAVGGWLQALAVHLPAADDVDCAMRGLALWNEAISRAHEALAAK